MCSNIFKYLFKSKKETEEPQVNEFRSRAEPMQEPRGRLFNIDEDWEEEYEENFSTSEEDQLLAFETLNIRQDAPSTPDSMKWRSQGAKPRSFTEARSPKNYFSYENALRRRRPFCKETFDYQPASTQAAKKMSEEKQSLEMRNAKRDDKPGMEEEEEKEDKYKKMMERETNAMFMLEEDYQRRHGATPDGASGWTI